MIRDLPASSSGAMTVEFALIMPAFLMLLTGTMEYCRYLWTLQTLNSVAYSTARCATFSSACATTAAIQSYAVAQASGYGLSVTTANVTYTSNTTCRSNTGQNMVTVSTSFASPLSAFVGAMGSTITGKACFTK